MTVKKTNSSTKKTTQKRKPKPGTRAKPGRPPFEITSKVLKDAELLASRGLTLYQIASCLGICYDTLNEKRKEYTEFSDAIKKGQHQGVRDVANKLYENAMKGDNTAIIFYLKNRDPENWEDLQKRKLGIGDGDSNDVQIIFNSVST